RWVRAFACPSRDRVARARQPELARKQHRRAHQHAEEKHRVRARDQGVIEPLSEMRSSFPWIRDSGGKPSHRDAKPVKADENFDIEVHALTKAGAIEQRYGWAERIYAESAHRIRNS